ncbi:Mitochondrial fission 1 protein [Nymphon striatum]|nr:Mitochondrial fission 1 protein [Nymphon striatum]
MKRQSKSSQVVSAKKQKYTCKYKDEWTKEYGVIRKSNNKGIGFAFCTLCSNDFSVSHGEVKKSNITCSSGEKFEEKYHEQLKRGTITTTAQFEYAWCLVKSRYPADIKKGTILLEDLVHNGNETARRDYLYYLAIGNTKLKDYDRALNFVSILRSVEPSNRQAKQLEDVIKKQMQKDGYVGMAIVGGIALAVGGILGLGFALAKK